MTKVLLFGGTSEARALLEAFPSQVDGFRYVTATAEGARAVQQIDRLFVVIGSKDEDDMVRLIETSAPRLVIDATHPYAMAARKNIHQACERTDTRLIRIERVSEKDDRCRYFLNMESLISWLEKTPGIIFSTLGASQAKALSSLESMASRIWLRILPVEASIRLCLDAGFPAKRLIALQGPFSAELNKAFFKHSDASILLTKESGEEGGFKAKVEAAFDLGMDVCVLQRPAHLSGLTLKEAIKQVKEVFA